MKNTINLKAIIGLIMLVCCLILTSCNSTNSPSDIISTPDDATATPDAPSTNETPNQNETPTNKETDHTHDFGEWEIVKEPNCTNKGMQERVCSCGEKETEELPKGNHDWLDATCNAPETCENCGETRGKKNEHSFTGDDPNECENCDYVRELKIKLPDTPLQLSYIGYDDTVKSRVKITSISCEIEYWWSDDDISIKISWAGEKTYDKEGNNTSSSCYIGYKLYDSEGFVIDSGMSWSTDVKVGEKFKNAEINIYELDSNESYTLEFLNYS